jgi:hypothetical protein
MDEILPWLITLVTLLLCVLGAQLLLHRDRWRRPGTQTTGDYRVAPRATRGAFAMPWPVLGASALAATWSIATLLFVAAGAILLALVADDGPAWFFALLAPTLVSGLVHAGLLVRGASRLVRRHEHAPRSSVKVALHGVVHHAFVLGLFLRWTWLEHRHDVDDTLMVLGPICLVGSAISALVVPAARYAPEGVPTAQPS